VSWAEQVNSQQRTIDRAVQSKNHFSWLTVDALVAMELHITQL
jgi:hypothetical protein